MAKKALARGRPDKKPVKRKRKAKPQEDDRPKEMTVGEQTYTVGDVAWFVDEKTLLTRPRPRQGELTDVYPNDNIAPAVGLTEHESGKYRAIRACLIGCSKKEALANFQTFLKSQEKAEK